MADPVPDTAAGAPAGGQQLTVRREHTRERLVAAAIQVFAERGVIGASVEAICEQAGFTRGAFYSNFSDKDELVFGVLQHEGEQDYQMVEEIISELIVKASRGRKQPSELVAAAVPQIFADTTRETVLAQEEMDLYAARQPHLREAYQAFANQQRAWFAALVGQALDAVQLEFVLDFDEAITVLQDCCRRLMVSALLQDEPPRSGHIESLILAITRPRPASGPQSKVRSR
jgi:AcrR family transcriptional regulator